MKKVSVIILTYNSNLYKTLLTIESILRQSYNDFEIIISDDGSENNNYEEIKKYFLIKQFKRYKILNNVKNKGTVKNFLSALKVADGTYIRGIGAGDLFYSSNSLQYIVDGMEQYNGKIGFGKFQSYSWGNESCIKLERYMCPSNKRLFTGEVLYKDLTRSLLSGETISGASLFYEKEYLVSLLKELEDKVIYTEDLSRILTIVRGEKFVIINKKIVWYEFAEGGVSTSKNSEWQKKIREDFIAFDKILSLHYSSNTIAGKYLNKRKIRYIKNSFIRRLVLAITNPYLLFIKIMDFSPNNCNTDPNAFLCSEKFIDDVNEIYELIV